MPSLMRSVLRQELALGLKPASRICLDIETGATPEGRVYCWAVYDSDVGAVVPELDDALEGYIEGVGVRDGKEFNGEIPKKFCIHFDCGRLRYRVTAGLMSTFSRSLVNSLASLTPEQTAQPLRLSVRLGDRSSSGKVVLPRLVIPQTNDLDIWLGPKFEPIGSRDIDAMRTAYRQVLTVLPEIEFNGRGGA